MKRKFNFKSFLYILGVLSCVYLVGYLIFVGVRI